MKVRELIEKLQKYDPELDVELSLTYEEWVEWDDDGWTEYDIQDSTKQGSIDEISEVDGVVVLDCYDGK